MKPLQDLGPASATYLKMRDLATYLGYTGTFAVDSAQRFVARHGLRRYWRSAHCAMVKVSDVDAAIAGAHPFPPGKKTALMRLTAVFAFAFLVAAAAPSFAQTVDPLTGEWCNPGDCLGPPGPPGPPGPQGPPGPAGPPGTCAGLCSPPNFSVHLDYKLTHPLTAWHPGDLMLTSASLHGPIPRIVHYFKATDVLIIIDQNLPADRNVIAFQRGGEPTVRFWDSIAAFTPGVLVYSGPSVDGAAYTCIVSDDKLLAFFAARGLPVLRTNLQQFVTGGGPPIPLVPASLFDEFAAKQ